MRFPNLDAAKLKKAPSRALYSQVAGLSGVDPEPLGFARDLRLRPRKSRLATLAGRTAEDLQIMSSSPKSGALDRQVGLPRMAYRFSITRNRTTIDTDLFYTQSILGMRLDIY